MLHERDGDIARPELILGARVKVIKDPESGGPWPSEPEGVIIAQTGDPLFRVVSTKWGPVREYWVRFDTPQRDDNGLGPYSSAVIWQQYLRVLDSESP